MAGLSAVAPHLNVGAGLLDPKMDGKDGFVIEPPNLRELDIDLKGDVELEVSHLEEPKS